MAIILKFSLQGAPEISRLMNQISLAVTNLTAPFDKSGEDMVRLFQDDVFKSEGQAIDETWDPLSRAYALQKEKKYPDKGILEATGAMRQSFFYVPDSSSLVVWNDAEYFKYHQSTEPRFKIPRRAMMKLTQSVKENVIKNLQQYLKEIT